MVGTHPCLGASLESRSQLCMAQGRDKDESHQEPQSEHSWHADKLLQRHSWSGGQDLESKAAEGGWALTFRVLMLPREREQEGLEGADLRAKGACSTPLYLPPWCALPPSSQPSKAEQWAQFA